MEKKYDSFNVALFLYATLIVDIVRRINVLFNLGLPTDLVRNILYLFSFVWIVHYIYKRGKITNTVMIIIVMMWLYLFSYVLNPTYSNMYIQSFVLFVTRLLPAYCIGRYFFDWDGALRVMQKFVFVGVLYSFLILLFTDTTANIYATLAQNLIYPALFVSFISIKNKQWVYFICSSICWIPLLLYGTRVVFVGVLISLFLCAVNSAKHKIITLSLLMCSVLVVLLFFQSNIISYLGEEFSSSRTVQMFKNGSFFDDSNRSVFYSAILNSIQNTPFKMYGFLGDRIFLSSCLGVIDPNDVESMFSHNVVLELIMNFGILIGLLISLCAIITLFRGFFLSFTPHSYKYNIICNVFLMLFGPVIVTMFVSSSYLNDYTIWLLFGLAINIIKTEKNTSNNFNYQ